MRRQLNIKGALPDHVGIQQIFILLVSSCYYFITRTPWFQKKPSIVVAKDAGSNLKAALCFVFSEYANLQLGNFGAMWKVADDVKAAMLGLKLRKFILGLNSRSYLGLDLNETSYSIYQLMKLNVGQMYDFVLLNQTLAKYMIAQAAGKVGVYACPEKYRLTSQSEEGWIGELISNSRSLRVSLHSCGATYPCL